MVAAAKESGALPKNIRKRGSIYWYRITKNGTPFEGSLETNNLGIAKERLESVRRELTASKFGEKPRRTFNEAAIRFMDEHCKRHLKPKARKRYGVSLRNLTDHLCDLHLDEIGSAILGTFEKSRLDAGATTSTVRRDLACLSSLYSRAEEWEWVTFNPVKPFKRGRGKAGLKEGNPRERYWSELEELTAIPLAPPKAQDAIGFAIDTGLRKEEQFSLLISDIDFAAKEVRVRPEIAKNGRSRTVPLLDRALAIALRLSQDRIGDVPLFVTKDGARYSAESPTMYEALQKAARRAGVAQTSWHDLRRTCGCRLLQVYGKSMEEVSAWLGHADIRITQKRYAFLKAGKLHEGLRPSNVHVLKTERTKLGTEMASRAIL